MDAIYLLQADRRERQRQSILAQVDAERSRRATENARDYEENTKPAVYPVFADTVTPEDYYTDSVRGLLDDEFSADVPRDPPTFVDRLAVCVLFFAGLFGIWWGIDRAVQFFGG